MNNINDFSGSRSQPLYDLTRSSHNTETYSELCNRDCSSLFQSSLPMDSHSSSLNKLSKRKVISLEPNELFNTSVGFTGVESLLGQKTDNLKKMSKRKKTLKTFSSSSERNEMQTKSLENEQSHSSEPSRLRWTTERVDQLQSAVKLCGSAWKDVAAFVPGTSFQQCRQKWRELQAGVGVEKGRWESEEDEDLEKAVKICGTVWKNVANLMTARNARQCYKRWAHLSKKNVKEYALLDKQEQRVEPEKITPSLFSSPFVTAPITKSTLLSESSSSSSSLLCPSIFSNHTLPIETYSLITTDSTDNDPELSNESTLVFPFQSSPSFIDNFNLEPLEDFSSMESHSTQSVREKEKIKCALKSDAVEWMDFGYRDVSKPAQERTSEKGHHNPYFSKKNTGSFLSKREDAQTKRSEKNRETQSKNVPEVIPNREKEICSEKGETIHHPQVKKSLRKSWTKEEDELLKNQVEVYGHHWKKVSRQIPQRSHKQCEGRWRTITLRR